jgi:hypothetical protein
MELPPGLRHVLVYVNVTEIFPLESNSPNDIALLRSANLAMRRKAQYITDSFLFLIANERQAGAARKAIEGYGFPAFEIMLLGRELEQSALLWGYDTLQEEAGQRMESWMSNKHPGAIAFNAGAYDDSQFWWTGIEHDDDIFHWPFEVSDMASELPRTHKERAETWLTILGHASDIHAAQASLRTEVGEQKAAVLAATLCEWLHGFEAAAGHDYNQFDRDSASRSLGFSCFFLGFEASRLSGNELDEFCDEHGEDIIGLGAAVLALITREARDELRSDLSRFFGGDALLFWSLHSAIWPQFDQPMMYLFDKLIGLNDHEDFAKIEAPWTHVTLGWAETADE